MSQRTPIFACHCDLEPGMVPDACVMDANQYHLCVYAERLKREGKPKESCEYWRPVEPKQAEALVQINADLLAALKEAESALRSAGVIPLADKYATIINSAEQRG